jgi:ABC-2 type transport system ATP-binding protein
MIEVKNLTKRYGDHVALNNMSFSVGENTIIGFLGPNGAGKSTTMNIITGYLSASSAP